ncbi:hypothetical protein [uncultured Deinococcus sp.]|uniref:hypothetical protein n=1 Tax=uncultured Deinococcus sp. TaxID=158789 RepID=UPI00258B8B61|nr:hypothetical protein [uncultured Deinococcus sp.]
MKTATHTLALLLALPLSACGTLGAPVTTTLGITGVRLPETVAPTAPLDVAIDLVHANCEYSGERVILSSRTQNTLTLKTEVTRTQPGAVCNTGISYGTLTYTDPGTPARMGPFEVIVDGKSWGKVSVR